MTAILTILIVEPDKTRTEAIIDSLVATGDHHIRVLTNFTGLASSVAELNPDLVLVDITNPNRNDINALTRAVAPLDRPVALFVDRSDDGLSKAAIEAGISAYVVDGMHPDRIKPILEAAITRFHLVSGIRSELAETKRALEDRKIIDRAKGILMQARNIPEDEAYALLRKTAMHEGKKMARVAQALVTASDLLS
ncbi:ANTAR domain-containing response regulator [Shimia sagamensis]|uniref:Response regulator receiver and ANTAR domain protein n=1 Tax=Shimia sagamensis TaxID=1566352 RepID=A0ABY1NTT5_9RHOB|nr:ANTAR domain-containing protein [Shimia sagamensis]SMP17986.1 response regulator receiver and ANTAR domain protein [Shimia sagamensis]